VTQAGGASWAYRYKVNGKERWMGLGGLYDVNIDEAREQRWNARQLLKKDKVAALDKRKAERDARALAEVWRTVVDSMPADHFIPANHLLTQPCRHVVEARRIAQLIKAYRKKKTDFNIRLYGELLKAQLSESSISSSASPVRCVSPSNRTSIRADDYRDRLSAIGILGMKKW
jgi:hypothetical protein